MYTVKQVNTNGTVVYPASIPLTLLQSIKWVERTEKMLFEMCSSEPEFYIIRQTKEDIIEKLKDMTFQMIIHIGR